MAPLITPSASPQPRRVSSRTPRHTSPLKNQRRSFHESASSSKSRTQTPLPDVQKEREASTLRLLDVWAGLAERYSRHMDDDDLVDIRTGEIIRDNGVLRNAPTLQFGTLAAPLDEVNEVEEEDEYDFDELDAFAETTIDTDEESDFDKVETGGSIVPPATLLNQAYADDLREFLEAEKIRKEQCGTDVDEDSEDQQSIREVSADDGDDVVEVVRAAERRLVRSDDKMEFLPRGGEDKKDRLMLIEGQGTCSEPIVVPSDDELDFWKADKSNSLRVVHKDGIDVVDTDIEIVGSATPFSCQKLPPKDSSTKRKNARTPKTRQLHTPPRSQSSSKLSVSPFSTVHSDALSDFSGNDSSPSGHHRKRNPHVKPTSPKFPNSMVHSSAKIFRRGHSTAGVTSHHTKPYITDTMPDESTRKSPFFMQVPKAADVVEASPKRHGKHPQSHSLKRKRESYSVVDVSEVAMESPKRRMAQNRSASANYSPPTKWLSKEFQSDSDSGYDEPIPEQNQRVHRKRSASCAETRAQISSPYTYATPNHRNHAANMFTPIPDPRAQLIIAQAVQQLSALVTGIWQPPSPQYLEESSPHTPQRRSMSVQPSHSLHTPLRPYMYHSYDPAFSGASLPPESPPEPEHYTTTSRRSLVSRSSSRVRRVTFQLNGEESDTQEVSSDTHRTPTSNKSYMNADLSERDDYGSERQRRVKGRTPVPSSNFYY